MVALQKFSTWQQGIPPGDFVTPNFHLAFLLKKPSTNAADSGCRAPD